MELWASPISDLQEGDELEIGFTHMANDLINLAYIIKTLNIKAWKSFLVGEHTNVLGGWLVLTAQGEGMEEEAPWPGPFLTLSHVYNKSVVLSMILSGNTDIVNILEYFLCARYSANHFMCIFSTNFHNSSIRQLLYCPNLHSKKWRHGNKRLRACKAGGSWSPEKHEVPWSWCDAPCVQLRVRTRINSNDKEC